MQFFEHQDQARGRTTVLVVLFSLAVVCLGLFVAASVHVLLSMGRQPQEPLSDNHWSLVATAAICTWGTIALGSFYRMAQLAGGGKTVAETLGGTLLNPTTTDPLERRVINVVEEMAIASGLPVPPVYLLRNEKGINAFAAGWSPDDAVIGVTQGALEGLKRDQLQGVIAHEFSHILNRDCALYMRMMGVLHGILVISILGRIVMQWGSSSRHTSTRREGGAVQIFLLGAGIWLFGSLGVLLARFIQAAVSQQREFLADASAVQFTRNPEGIAGALATIGSQTSALASPRGAETSHMLFGEPGKASFLNVLSSHPPLFERIARILPRWDGDFSALATPPGSVIATFAAERTRQLEADYIPGLPREQGTPRENPSAASLSEDSAQAENLAAQELLAGGLLLDPVDATDATAKPNAAGGAETTGTLGHAQRILADLPALLRDAAETPFSCRAVVVALALHKDYQKRAEQDTTPLVSELELCQRAATMRSDVALTREVERLFGSIVHLSPQARLPLFDIALSTLAGFSASQRAHFEGQLRELSTLVSARSYGAYCLLAITRRHLDCKLDDGGARPLLIKSAIETILSILAREGHDSLEQARVAFQVGARTLGKRGTPLCLLEPQALDVSTLDASLLTLLRLPASTRADILNAAEAIAQNDGVVRPSEVELLRTLALSLHLAVRPDRQTD